ncbi:MAG: cytochrome c3 family protein [Pseudomonadota bacterium]
MKVLLVTLRKRAGSEDVSRRETMLEGDQIRIGRGVAMEINLPDIDVDFHHASLQNLGAGLSMVAVSDSGLRVGKRSQPQVQMGGGEEVQIGRYKFRSEAGRDGADFVLIMEEAPEEAKKRRSRAGSKRRLAEVLPSRRMLGWVISLAVVGLFFAWPMSDVLTREAANDDIFVVDGMARTDVPEPTVMEIAWSSGPISESHAMIQDDCAACHLRPFEMTTNNACLACHATSTNHADIEKHPAVSLENTRCASCHKEHNGGLAPVDTASTACATCHSDIKSVSAESQLGNISGFATDHTPFKLAVIVGVDQGADGSLTPQVERVPFDPKNPPLEGSGLKFPHAKHLQEGGMKTADGQVQLQCADCHVQEPGGKLMRPIKFDRDCSGCHEMLFNAGGLERLLPHAQEDEVARIVNDHFIAAALDGTLDASVQAAPVAAAVKTKRKRRIAGQNTNRTRQSLSSDQRGQAIKAAQNFAVQQMDVIFGSRLCGTCHEVRKNKDAEGVDRWRVEPALLQRHWMPRAKFDHDPHRVMDCTNCHNAPVSKASSDVLMPGIETCQSCHQGEGELDGARSECVDCHEYHIPTRTPMSPEHAEIFEARASARQRSKPAQQ